MSQSEDKKLILVVEDEQLYMSSLVEKIGKEGFSVISAKNGEEGLAAAIKDHPDLILLDLVMPKVDGMTMLGQLRSYNQWGKKVPVYILTSLPSSDEKILKFVDELTPVYYIDKSDITLSDLIEKIKETLNQN